MPVVRPLHRGWEEVWACLTQSQTEPREWPHCGEPHCFARSTSQTRTVIPELAKKKNAVQVFSFKVSLGTFTFSFFLFIRSDQIQILRPLRPSSCPVSAPRFPTTHRMNHVPLMWGDHLFALLPPWEKEKKIMWFVLFCFATDLAIWNSSPFSGSEAAVSQSAISSCFVPVSAGEILNSLCTKLFLNFILFWNFASLGLEHTGHPIWRWSSLHPVCGLAVCWSLKVSFPTRYPLLVKFLWGLLGAHPAAYWLTMYSPLVWSRWRPVRRKKPIEQLFWYWKLTSVFLK